MDGRTRSSVVAKLWVGVFVVWIALLSGVFAHWLGEGPPGFLQAIRLRSLLNSKTEQLTDLQTEVHRLGAQATLLAKSRITQYREIRKVLGYAAADEIIFDFGSTESLN